MVNKVSKILISIIMIVTIIVSLGFKVVYAADNARTIKLDYKRGEKAYALNTGSNHPVFQIVATDDNGVKIGTNYYCLNATKGTTWVSNNVGTKVDYDKSYDLVDKKSDISKLTVKTYSDVVANNYGPIMWILDNMYTEGGISIERLLNKAGIVKGDTGATDARINGTISGYYYDPEVNPSSKFSKDLYKDENFFGNSAKGQYYGYIENGKVVDVILSKEQIEVVQQAAIWYFTNYLPNNNAEYNCYTTTINNDWIRYTSNPSGAINGWELLASETKTVDGESIKTGKMLQEQASILCNYLIENAKTKSNYTSTSAGKIEFIPSVAEVITEGNNYKVGPLKIKTTEAAAISGGLKILTGTNEDITSSATVTGTSKAIPEANKEFYITVPKSKVNGSIKIKISGSTSQTKKTLWLKSTTIEANAEQPIVEIKPETIPDAEITVTLKKQFDLALRKRIIAIKDNNGKTKNILAERLTGAPWDGARPEIIADISQLKNGEATTAVYKHRKDPVIVENGDIVSYELSIYNEGEIDGYASKIVDQLPDNLTSAMTETTVTSENGNVYNVSYDSVKNQIILTLNENAIKNKTAKIINAFDENKLLRDTVTVTCKVNQEAETDGKTKHYLTNIAYISEAYDKDGNKIEQDRDNTESRPSKSPTQSSSDLNSKDANSYKGSGNTSIYDGTGNNIYYAGQEDDDDFEKLVVLPKVFDLSLRKFITKINDNELKNSREPQVDTTKLKDRTATTAIYNHSKSPIELNIGDYILYTLRVYNEGDLDGYASQITDYLPEYLNFVDTIDGKKVNSYWTYDSTEHKVITKQNAPNVTTKLKAFDAKKDKGAGEGLSYVDLEIICKVNDNAPVHKKLTNIAEITEYRDENKNVIKKDIDSESDDLKYPENVEKYQDDEIEKKYVPGQEDDDDFEKVIIKEPKKFDLALRKFITNISGKKVDTRIPQVSYKEKIIYTHPKDVVKVIVGDTVTYTLRVFNEGDIAGFAEKITDDIPDFLEYLPENNTNKKYRWTMIDRNGKSTTNVADAVKIVTDYTSKENGETLMKQDNLKENPNLLNAFDKTAKISNTNPDYVDVQVAFKVKDPNSNKYVIVNKAQISEDADENGNPVKDIDSTPDKWKDGEDDQDYENVSVEYFDLSLLKYVTKAIVTENGKTKITKTGNTGAKTDITPKVEIYRKRVKSTIVKFEFTIKVTNEGDIAGYAKEITDYVPEGLKFYKEDNKGWNDEGNNVISTTLLKDTLLEPGQSATVKVILRWINGENNLGLKTNIAEISKDYNEKGVPDRDSVPGNKKTGEDDIDDAPVLLTISTGILENPIPYIAGTLVILVVLGLGLITIKKYVL